MKSPCEQCISYAMCVGKKTIECDDFHVYTSHIGVNYNPGNDPPYDIHGYWKHVNSILPKLSRILPGRNIL